MWTFRLAALAFGVASGLAGAVSASAQVVINGTFYEESKTQGCISFACTLEFTAPASRVLFTKLACEVRELDSQVRSIQFGVRDSSNAVSRRTEPVPAGVPFRDADVGINHYATTVPLDFLSAAGKLPAVQAEITRIAPIASFIRCKITGRIQP